MALSKDSEKAFRAGKGGGGEAVEPEPAAPKRGRGRPKKAADPEPEEQDEDPTADAPDADGDMRRETTWPGNHGVVKINADARDLVDILALLRAAEEG